MSVTNHGLGFCKAHADCLPGLRLLAMKTAPIEKFQYLVHLKATNPHLFYRLLSENIKVRRSTCNSRDQD
jgi:hypothetical protein